MKYIIFCDFVLQDVASTNVVMRLLSRKILMTEENKNNLFKHYKNYTKYV